MLERAWPGTIAAATGNGAGPATSRFFCKRVRAA
jgi:hypothetical protein